MGRRARSDAPYPARRLCPTRARSLAHNGGNTPPGYTISGDGAILRSRAPAPLQVAHDLAHPLDAFLGVLVGAAALQRHDAIPAGLVEVGHAGPDVVGIDAAADGN